MKAESLGFFLAQKDKKNSSAGPQVLDRGRSEMSGAVPPRASMLGEVQESPRGGALQHINKTDGICSIIRSFTPQIRSGGDALSIRAVTHRRVFQVKYVSQHAERYSAYQSRRMMGNVNIKARRICLLPEKSSGADEPPTLGVSFCHFHLRS